MLFTAVKPMLAERGNEAFDDDRYLFEPKWDGWRILLHKQGDRLEAYTRSGQTVTGKFPELGEVVSSIKAPSAVLDCEGVCLREGRPVFDDFAYRGRLGVPKRIASAVRTHPATFIVFDVLRTNEDHLNEPLSVRKDRLNELIDQTNVLALTASVRGQGKALHDWTIRHDMEGMVAKRIDSAYSPGVVSQDWLKIKNAKRIDVIILGYRSEPRFELVIGLHFRTVRYKPVGSVEEGIGDDEKEAFLEIAKTLHTAYDNRTGTQWIEPRLCCRIQYLDRSEHHQLGLTVFKGFLFDQSPEECYWTY